MSKTYSNSKETQGKLDLMGPCSKDIHGIKYYKHGDAAAQDIGNGIYLRCNSPGRGVTNRSRLWNCE